MSEPGAAESHQPRLGPVGWRLLASFLLVSLVSLVVLVVLSMWGVRGGLSSLEVEEHNTAAVTAAKDVATASRGRRLERHRSDVGPGHCARGRGPAVALRRGRDTAANPDAASRPGRGSRRRRPPPPRRRRWWSTGPQWAGSSALQRCPVPGEQSVARAVVGPGVRGARPARRRVGGVVDQRPAAAAVAPAHHGGHPVRCGRPLRPGRSPRPARCARRLVPGGRSHGRLGDGPRGGVPAGGRRRRARAAQPVDQSAGRAGGADRRPGRADPRPAGRAARPELAG